MFKPTKEQERIFHFIKNRKENLVIDAKAGVGKTTTIVELLKLIPKEKKIIFLAFNKHIQEELKNRLPEHVHSYTFHGLGVGAIKRIYGDSIKFDEFKLDQIIKNKSKEWHLDNDDHIIDVYSYLENMKKLANLCRLTLTLDRKYITYLADKFDIPYNEDLDGKRLWSVMEELMNNRKSFDFTDMVFLPAIDNKIWMFQYDYVLVDECQDLNRAQQKIIEKIVKRDKITKKLTGRIIAVGDQHQCQPEGTKVLLWDGTEKNIEDIVIGDLVVSYNNKSKNGSFIGKHEKELSPSLKERAPKVENIQKRHYNGNLIVIKSNGKISKYTPNHRTMVSFKKESLKKYVLFLMQKGEYFRIGVSELWSLCSNKAKQENVNKFWILKTYDDKLSASIDEQYYSLKYSIPQLRFVNNQKSIDDFYKNFQENFSIENINNLLQHFNKDIDYPFWYRNMDVHFSKKHMFEINCCNILPDLMNIIIYDEKNVIRSIHSNIDEFIYEKYNGFVYSLDVSKYKLYVADGILTHNSIYGFTGVSDKSYEWFLKMPNVEVLPLTYTFRCAKSIVEKAQEIVPEIKYLDNAPEGIVREGSVLDEPQDGDFVLCRTTTPLIKLFFYYLLQGRKATIMGSDIGLSLIEMIEGHKTIPQMMAHWANKLKEYEISLRKRGILKFEEDSEYIALQDKINVLKFLSKLSKDIDDMISKIKTIFSEKQTGIILSTIHKAKGLEAERVFIARPDKIPLQVSKAWQYKQEKNLEYVAITRAKRELIYDNQWNDEESDNFNLI